MAKVGKKYKKAHEVAAAKPLYALASSFDLFTFWMISP